MSRITRTVLVALVLAIALVGMGCSSGSEADQPRATTTTINPGIQARKDAEAARRKKCASDYHQLQRAIARYRDEERKEPTSLRLLVPDYLVPASPSWKLVVKDGKATIALSAGGIEVGCKVPKD